MADDYREKFNTAIQDIEELTKLKEKAAREEDFNSALELKNVLDSFVSCSFVLMIKVLYIHLICY